MKYELFGDKIFAPARKIQLDIEFRLDPENNVRAWRSKFQLHFIEAMSLTDGAHRRQPGIDVAVDHHIIIFFSVDVG